MPSATSVLYLHTFAVVRRPDTTHAGFGAGNCFVGFAQFVATSIAQQFYLLQNLVRGKVSYAYGLRAAVDVVSNDDGVLSWTRRNGKFDLRGCGCELGEK